MLQARFAHASTVLRGQWLANGRFGVATIDATNRGLSAECSAMNILPAFKKYFLFMLS